MKPLSLLSLMFSNRSKSLWRGLLALVLAAAGSQCASPVSSSSDGTLGGSARTASTPAEMRRPGLGTGFGEARWSEVDSTTFRRSSSTPDATTKVFYNDRQGVQAAAGYGGDKFNDYKQVAGGLVSFGLKSEGGWLRGVESGGEVYVMGEPGDRYDILLRNESHRRIEVVVSVDGLDVLDGRPASVQKRGYVIPAQGSVRIEGWRTSMNQVAAFRFANVRNSYAALKHGNTKNVGVIGVAVFTEDHPRAVVVEPSPGLWRTGDVQRRRDANPFPASSRWATPP
ncbi:hypothetical protein [Verrucomicrobium spinosum]|uniref:hypothetical protein n=1 Tax=Verrucomicrobium spinosum TaxID=2736 RepID=UPI0012E292B7|nr:hypothetical protein [Verrucomicrobium spinosum]